MSMKSLLPCLLTAVFLSSSLDSASSAQPKCADDPDYFHKYETRTCAFIDDEQWKRERYCSVKKTYNRCERTCGKCCEDATMDEFSFTVRNIERDCKWIAKTIKRPRVYCDVAANGYTVQDYCPDACGVCRNTRIQPTPSPVAVCGNDDEWSYFNFPDITCKWIRNKEDRRQDFCSRGSAVTDPCPQTCGHCCEDHPSFSFRDNSIQKDITCDYIATNNKQNKYCDKWKNQNMVRDICPVACDNCFSVAGPTSPPTTYAQSCQNNDDWYWSSFSKMTCKWLRNKESRRQDFCTRNSKVKEECPQSCGVCCEDDDTYSMDNAGEETCAWIAKKKDRKETYCPLFENGRKVQDACPAACDMCLSLVEGMP